MSKIAQIIQFVTTDIWRIRSRKLSKTRSFWLEQFRVILLAFRGFNEDQCQLRASALTFYSLLSIVPVVAMAFGIAKGFGLETLLEKQLYARLPGQEEIIGQIVAFAHSFLENTRGGVIAGIGIVVLFWTVIKVLGNIEKSFNGIWGIKKQRSISRKFSDYLSIMLICPVLLIVSSSATVLIASQVTLIMEKISLLGFLSPAIMFLLNFLPYLVLWALFTFIYIFMPNVKVNFSAGLLGGIIGGTIYQVAQWAYVTFQIGVGKFGAIYGSFAALPLFLVWLQISWVIVLFGAEVSFAKQNVETYELEPDCLKASHSFKRLVALLITHLCVKNFSDGKDSVTAREISHRFEMPIRLVNQILFELTETKVLAEVKKNGETFGYHPAKDISHYTIKNVLNMLDHYGIDDIPIAPSQELENISKRAQALNQTIETLPDNVCLKDI